MKTEIEIKVKSFTFYPDAVHWMEQSGNFVTKFETIESENGPVYLVHYRKPFPICACGWPIDGSFEHGGERCNKSDF